ncbi:hypothetical protein AC1031_021586 [Aphanomyces cochlioides]|nr:hypothetical protein AC1031_021586 [Aphanomyces cochlioides]
MPSVRPCRSIKALVPDEEVSLCQMSNKTSAWVVLNPHAAVRHTLPNWHLFGSISNECISNVLSFLDGQFLAAASHRECIPLYCLHEDSIDKITIPYDGSSLLSSCPVLCGAWEQFLHNRNDTLVL